MSTVNAAGTTVTHRYPWTLEERLIIAFFLLAPTVATALLSLDGADVVLGVALHVVGLAAAFGLYRLGRSRKDRSMVCAQLHGTRLTVTGGRVKSSRGDLADAHSVVVEQLGPETVLVLGGTGATPLRVPMRLAGDRELAATLRTTLLHDGVSLSAQARELLAAL